MWRGTEIQLLDAEGEAYIYIQQISTKMYEYWISVYVKINI
jgi:hypothetical protein